MKGYKAKVDKQYHCLSTGQTYTRVYITFTNVLYAIVGSVKLLLTQYWVLAQKFL